MPPKTLVQALVLATFALAIRPTPGRAQRPIMGAARRSNRSLGMIIGTFRRYWT